MYMYIHTHTNTVLIEQIGSSVVVMGCDRHIYTTYINNTYLHKHLYRRHVYTRTCQFIHMRRWTDK